MKKTKKLGTKKVTLKNLDEPVLKAVAGGFPHTAFCNTPKVSCLVACL